MLIIDRRDRRVLIQTDSLEVTNVIQDDPVGNSNSTLIKRIQQTLSMVKQWKTNIFPRKKTQLLIVLSRWFGIEDPIQDCLMILL